MDSHNLLPTQIDEVKMDISSSASGAPGSKVCKVEVVGGIKANSLAILTDAAHLLSDVAAFAISLFSLWAAGWEATPQQSYGFFRIEILGALVSIQLIWLLAGILVCMKLFVRLIHDSAMDMTMAMDIHTAIVMVIQMMTIPTMKNKIMAMYIAMSMAIPVLLRTQSSVKVAKKPRRNINVHSAYLHVLGDSIQSIGVMIGGAVIWMLRNILEVLMESTPREIDATRLERGLCEMDGVVAVHELHIWAITVGKVLLACHVTIAQDADAEILDKVIGYIKTEYNISHVTIQIERQ
ncbi:hypothetical protein PR202_gb25009 [Eleusine coracana subsp. coracana]|uniref:Uncharacterized protein n=1 Tax=Eleusine coracana subsp. coracana TaxID=191504 RepID=A0AAV5FMU3_ELECO|nr:hypothetical protein PR202_gb25009 [Eleusine coracana subsp. coracana]